MVYAEGRAPGMTKKKRKIFHYVIYACKDEKLSRSSPCMEVGLECTI